MTFNDRRNGAGDAESWRGNEPLAGMAGTNRCKRRPSCYARHRGDQYAHFPAPAHACAGGRHQRQLQSPSVGILIPARNEAEVIAFTVTSILAQRYPHLELIVLDDNSDGTALAAQAAAAEAGGTHHFRLLCGQPLPPGWMGKNWACHQLRPS